MTSDLPRDGVSQKSIVRDRGRDVSRDAGGVLATSSSAARSRKRYVTGRQDALPSRLQPRDDRSYLDPRLFCLQQGRGDSRADRFR
jgi:hypothetical protein